MKKNNNNSNSHNKNDNYQNACYDSNYLTEWEIPKNDNLVDISGYPLLLLQKKFNLPEYDECISMHSCAITKKIPLNGTLYVYNSRICFFSRYNSDTLVGKATVISISIQDISSVLKKKTGFIFDQGIEILLKNNHYMSFSAFKDRDQAYNYISELLEWQKKLQPTNEDLNIECIRQELQQLKQQKENTQIRQKYGRIKKIFNDNDQQKGNGKQDDCSNGQDIIELSDEEFDQWEEIRTTEEVEKQKNEVAQWNQHTNQLTLLYQSRVDKLRNQVLNHYEVNTKAKWTSINIKNITAKEIYILFFGNNQFEDDKQQQYSNFSIYYNTNILNELNMVYSEIVPDPPVYYTNLYDNNKLEIIDYPEYSTRKCTFTHLIKESFMPKSCECSIVEKIYWVSPKEILIERELTFEGLPLSSNFTPRVLYQITESEDSSQTCIKSGYYIHQLKDTWFKSKIELKQDEENMKNWEKISKLYIKYSELWIKRREQGLQLQKKQNVNLQKQQNQIKDIQQQLSETDLQNQDSSEVEFIQSTNTDQQQIAEITDASQSICSIF